MIIQEIPQWMGSLAQVKVQAVSLQEAKEILAGLKHLEKANLKRLQAQLSAMQLGSALSVTDKPFTLLAASSGTTMAPSAAPRPLAIGDQPTRALYMSDDDGTTTDVSVVPKKKSDRKRGHQGGRWGRRSLSGSQTDSSSTSSVSSRTGKKTGSLPRSPSLSTMGREGTSTMSPPSVPGPIPSPTTITTMRTTICSHW